MTDLTPTPTGDLLHYSNSTILLKGSSKLGDIHKSILIIATLSIIVCAIILIRGGKAFRTKWGKAIRLPDSPSNLHRMASQAIKNPRWIPGAPPLFFQEIGMAVDKLEITSQPTEELVVFKSAIQETEQTVSFDSMYGADDVPVFGRQYGMGGSSKNGESSATGALMSSPPPRRRKLDKSLNPYEQLLIEADSDLDKYVGGSHKPSGLHGLTNYYDRPASSVPRSSASGHVPEDPSKPLLGYFGPSPTTCVVCTEDFTPRLKPPVWITTACLHEPSVCCTCLAQSIKSDLEDKLWDQIRCPEENCDAILIYDDVKRLADAITFARYEILSFRSAVSTDPNFTWCQSCNFGQLHASGNSSPIVRCLNCNHRTCFTHQVAWHEGLTCTEYDLMLTDPDNFVPAVDQSNAVVEKEQEQVGEQLPREESHRQRLAEQKRQRLKHEEMRREARDLQNAEAVRKREIYDKDQSREELRNRLRQEKASLEKVDATTKRCPGCRWPIEKNEGCAHMTCIKCTYEFCWDCLSEFKQIREHGNSYHARGCRFHSENLPSA